MAKGIVANSALNAAAGMLLLLTGFACSIIAARLLGPEANGIIAFSLWLATTGALVAELGTGVILLRMLPQLRAQGYDAARRRGFAAFLVTPTLISTVILAVLYWLVFVASEELHWAETAPSIALVTGILFIIQSVGAFTKNYLIGEQRLDTFLKLTTVASVLQLVSVLAGAVIYGVEGALVGYAIGQVVLFAYTLTIIFQRRDRCDVPTAFLVSSSTVLSAQYLVDSILLNRIEILFLQQFWSVQVVGFYAVSLSLANLALQLPVQLTGSLLPYYSQRRHSTDDATVSPEVFAGVIRALSYITLPMSFGLAAISTGLVSAVFGEAFRPAGNIVALLALSAPAFVLMQILTQYLFSMDRTRTRLYAGIAGGGIIVIGCLLAVPWFGGEGAAFARLAGFTVMCLIMIRATGFGRSLSGLYVTLAKVSGASLMVAGAAMLAEYLIPGPVGIIFAIGAGFLVYPLALRILRAVPVEDGRVLINISGSLPGRLQPLFKRSILFVTPGAGTDVGMSGLGADQSLQTTGDPAEGAGRTAAMPVAFDGTIGLFTPEDDNTEARQAAVLLLPPWGFEEMCTRKFFRILSEHLAANGIPSLRFDYPGTGDAPGGPESDLDIGAWETAVLAAAERLKSLSGRERVILVGQGIGGMLAQRLGGEISGVDAIALLAPALNGRAYLREVSLWSKVVDQGLGLREDQRDNDGVSIASLKLPAGIADAIRKTNLTAPQATVAGQVLVLERPVRMSDTGFADGLRELGAHVVFDVFEGYDDLVANPTIQKMPMETIAKLIGWLGQVNPVATGIRTPNVALLPAELAGDGYRERFMRFGDNDHLYGVFCMPEVRQDAASVLILTTAYDRSAGWGRSGVNTARELARHGIASFRYDTANVGDSVPLPEAPRQILYSTTQNRDVDAALDLMEQELGGKVLVSGRCSGGYLALRNAVRDQRLTGVVSVNPFVLYWDPERPVDAGLQFVPRSLDDYGQRFARVETLKRLFTGEIDIPAAGRNIAIAIAKRLARKATPLVRQLPGNRHIHREVKDCFRTFQERQIPVSLIYSEGDVGLDDLHLHFGEQGSGLSGYGNVKLTMLPDTDHNLTPAVSRRVVFDEILRLAKAA
ncbi:alpha/beta fold hydrolase [Rhizobium sp. TH2]|uniref:alpha/beta fold hydrolase n=1 Tax=Rhizobium sp. TH2 TaxID=2775403 RepID=UPI0021583C90|nr:alpha/beta fold hydrolase [Rhizobium sp. TH2]UVC09626.1 alpha/beta fold hydrolase [Rhizobium sp. TH2]